MLGRLIAQLHDPRVAGALMTEIGDDELSSRLNAAAGARADGAAGLVADTVRDFVRTADDDQWLQLVGIMNRAADPGVAAVRAILVRALPAPAKE